MYCLWKWQMQVFETRCRNGTKFVSSQKRYSETDIPTMVHLVFTARSRVTWTTSSRQSPTAHHVRSCSHQTTNLYTTPRLRAKLGKREFSHAELVNGQHLCQTSQIKFLNLLKTPFWYRVFQLVSEPKDLFFITFVNCIVLFRFGWKNKLTRTRKTRPLDDKN